VSAVIWILIAVMFLFGGTLGILAVLVIGIRTDDRGLNVRHAPRTRAEVTSRRLLVGVRNSAPDVEADDTEEN
jgi:hypothetical protein